MYQVTPSPVVATASASSVAGDALSLSSVWQSLAPTLQTDLGAENYAAWLANLRVHTQTETGLVLAAPTTFIAQWVQSNYLERLEDLFSQAAGRPVNLTLQVVPTFASLQSAASAPLLPVAVPQAQPQPEWLNSSRMDPRHTFAQFVTGKSNQFAFAAAQSVAESLVSGGQTYNPLFFHGGVGLGKTHLMQAIGHAVQAAKPNSTILYLTAEQFLLKFIRALKDKNTLAFKEAFRKVDILMVDDFQFIAGRESSQEEFFHTFNTLMQDGKHLIFTADKSPHELANIEERLKSRLGSGLTVELHAPDEETRLAILQSKAETIGYAVPADVLQLLAGHIASNVRELEGALNRVIAYARLTGEELTTTLAREQLRDLFRVYNHVVTIDDIQQKVATQFNVRVSDMHSPRRAREVARPRQVAMYLAKQLTSRSYPDIGRAFGGRDHTTVIHACETITALLTRDAQLAEQVQMVTRTLQGRG